MIVIHINIHNNEVKFDPCCREMENIMLEDNVVLDEDEEQLYLIIGSGQEIPLNHCPNCGEKVDIDKCEIKERIRQLEMRMNDLYQNL